MNRVAVLCWLLGAACAPAANLAVVNARVWTGNPRQPWAEAIAISGDRIEAVGTNQEIRSIARPGARVIDGRGAMLTPGFIDAHFHLSRVNRSGAFPPANYRFVKSKRQLIDRIANYASNVPKGTWIIGEDWDERAWGGELPSRQWIDSVTPDHPVWIARINRDMALANSVALRLAGITRDTKEPPARGIVRDERGDPTGLIRGSPMWLVEAALLERDREKDERELEATMRRLAAAGITSVHHSGSWEELLLYRRLRRDGRLKVRIYSAQPLNAWERLREYVAAYGRGDSWLRWDALKGFGGMTREDAYRWVSGASRAKLQVMVHVFDQPGLPAMLDVYDRVRREQKLADPRFRIEHAHDVPADLIPVYARARVIASIQPPLVVKFDKPGAKYMFRCRDLLELGVPIAFGTDSVASSWVTSPLQSLAIAVDRAAPDGTRVTLEEALRAYTSGAAYAEFAEKEKGTLEPGKLADFVLFDCDMSRLPTHLVGMAKVVMTVAGGEVAFER